MADYKLHCFAQSGNAYKVALYLTLAGLDWEPVFVDYFRAAEVRSPEWRASVNEMGEAPGAGAWRPQDVAIRRDPHLAC